MTPKGYVWKLSVSAGKSKRKRLGGLEQRLADTANEKKKKKIIMKSVRRNAELTSFTFYTSAVAHIINITV